MALAQDGYAFLSMPHGAIVESGFFEVPIVTGQFFGVVGESHIIGSPQGRLISCEFTFESYATTSALETARAALAAKVGTLTGTLTETIGGNGRVFNAATFLGFQPDAPPFQEGATSNWVQFGRLLWRQRNP